MEYAGKPKAIKDPDKSIEGWVPTDDGAYVVNEPQGSPGWYPVNDSPRDKATFEFAITVPAGRVAFANGELISSPTTEDGKTTWRWADTAPMAPYLATATNGNFDTDFYTDTTNGLLMYDGVDPQTRQTLAGAPNPALAFSRLEPQPQIAELFSRLYGPYPFTSGGGLVDWAPEVGYALESQTRTNVTRIPSATTVVHEVAHQWFGNAVTPEVWPDIWLNEGFATFSEWIYDEMQNGIPASDTFDDVYATPADDEDLWFPAWAALHHPSQLFHTPVYDRGAMTLQALREKVGDENFFQHSPHLVRREQVRQRDHGRVHRSRREDQRSEPGSVLPGLALRGGQANRLVSDTGALSDRPLYLTKGPQLRPLRLPETNERELGFE